MMSEPVSQDLPSTDQEPAPRGPLIRISKGTGSGRTQLAAFDAALRDAGIADFNLVRLSSVIPPAAELRIVDGDEQLTGEHGDLLYCVYASAFASTSGDQAWAGVGWSLRTDGSGAGLFVEHHGSSRGTVVHDIETSLEDMSIGRDDQFETAGSLLASIECEHHPVCALVVATYQRQGWDGDAR